MKLQNLPTISTCANLQFGGVVPPTYLFQAKVKFRILRCLVKCGLILLFFLFTYGCNYIEIPAIILYYLVNFVLIFN